MTAEDDKHFQIEHVEGLSPTPLNVPHAETLLVDENVIRAEGEDKLTVYLVFLITIAAIAGFLFGYDTGIVGAALPLVGTDLGHELSSSEQEVITAATTIGAIPGALILGVLADRLGRKWAMAIADIAFTAGAIIIASSFSVPQIIVGRLVLGVGVGGAAVIAPLYIAELAPTAVRGRCVGTNAFFIPFGQTIASAIGAGFQGVPNGWRILFGFGVIPSIVQLCLMHWLPESPRVLLLRDRRDAANATLARIYSNATPEILALKLRVLEEHARETTRLEREFTFVERSKKLWTHKPYRRAIIAVCGVQAFGQLTGYNSLLYYSGTVFSLLGFKNGAAAGLIVSGDNALFVFVGMCIVDRMGRRRLLVVAVPFLIAGLVWASISFHFLTLSTGGVLLKDATYSPAVAGSLLGAIVCFVVFFGVSLSHVIWYQSEFFSLEIRAAGSALATTSCWLANLVIAVSYLSLMEKLTPAGTYGLYTGFCVIGYIFVLFCYPETKGLSIDETDSLFADGFGVKKSIEMRKQKFMIAKQMREAMQA
ncbi:hypothetical protein EHS25_009880 [Saitozyma podzolica]|uniref:Major facilitator superfamily (MFS) profile domain-containing protein n=1 Tax=Saitozyma podzolica TaxID=1890683 RepID=A0A427YKK5_9TREE|nr:hypothetical protein EHS25_009880 [Saitozyma podzolica]